MLIEQYIFITLFFTVFAFFIYVHVAYPFWVHMPVSHTYDIHHRLFYNTGNSNIQVLQQYPYRNKWISPKVQGTVGSAGTLEVKSISYHDLSEDVKTSVIDQLNCNYIPSDSILFTIEKKHFDVLFSGHFDTPFITTYCSSIGPLGKPSLDQNKPLGCLCSYPVRILYRQEKTASNNLVFLACDRDNPKNKEITRKLIATHEYNSRNRVTDIKTSILKKHTGTCAGVRPLLTFSTSLFYIGVNKKQNKGPSTIIQVYRENWSLMHDIADLLPRLFEFCAYMDVAALKARVDAGQLWIFVYKYKGDILAAYFIEDAMMLYEKVNDYGGKTLNLAASMCNMSKLQRSDGSDGPQEGNKVFTQGFADCLALIQKQNRDYTMLLMDDVGHNRMLAKNINIVPRGTVGSFRPLHVVNTTGAYYMINGFTKDPIDSDRAFMLI
jgi:hypothetical protein